MEFDQAAYSPILRCARDINASVQNDHSEYIGHVVARF